MAGKRKTLNFLPRIFRTDTNKKFLGSTLDQLISDPDLKRINGFVGRKFSASVRGNDNFIVENDSQRQNYQLEPAVISKNNLDNVNLVVTYPDLINKIEYYGGVVNDHNRLFDSEHYSFDPHIDLDKFVNYSNYRWVNDYGLIPPVIVSSFFPIQQSQVVFTRNGSAYTTNVTSDRLILPLDWSSYSLRKQVEWYNTRNITESVLLDNGVSPAEIIVLRANGYTGAISGPTQQQLNPVIFITRDKEYKFTVNHSPGQGNLWIQSEPGLSGLKYASNISTRTIYGVSNNGISSGNITINIPSALSQVDFLKFDTLVVDLAIDTTFTLSDNTTWANTSIYPDDKLVVFTSNSISNADWVDRTGANLTIDQRRGIWKSKTVTHPNGTVRVEYNFVKNLDSNVRVIVTDGKYQGFEFYKDQGNLVSVPSITSTLNTLYYQNDISDIVGSIRIIPDRPRVNVLNDILNELSYTSPNGIKFINGLRVVFDNTVYPVQYRNKEYIVEGVGKGIKLLDSEIFKQASAKSAFVNETKFKADYVTINRASMDFNNWSRTNNWIHVDVLDIVQQYRNIIIDPSSYIVATRPIIEFEPDLQLFNHGRKMIDTVTMFFDEETRYDKIRKLTDITTQIQGLSYRTLRSVLGFENFRTNLNAFVRPGDKAVFSYDNDPNVRARIYQFDLIDDSTSASFNYTLPGNFNGAIGSNFLIGIDTTNFPDLTGIEVGDSLFSSTNLFLGRIINIISSNQIQLDQPLTVNFNRATGFKIVFGRVDLKISSTASLHSSIFVTGPAGINGRSATLANALKSYHWARKIYSDPESAVPDVVYGWALSQYKQYPNQEPLFDIIIDNSVTFWGVSDLTISNLSLGEALLFNYNYNQKRVVFSNTDLIFRDSKFVGTKLFSYDHGSSMPDPELGFALSYDAVQGFIGDIKFVNNFDTDTFEYVGDTEGKGTLIPTNGKINIGFIRKNTGLGDNDLVKLTVWSTVGHYEPKPITGMAFTPTVNTSTTRALAEEINQIYINYLGRYPTQNELDTAVASQIFGYSVQGSFALSTFETTIKNSLEATNYQPFIYRIDPTKQLQHISHIYDGYTSYFDIDVQPRNVGPNPEVEPSLKLFINNKFVTRSPNRNPVYVFQKLGVRNTIKIDPAYLQKGDRVDILIDGPQTTIGYYQIPQNLEFNSHNEDIVVLTHGQVRNHLERVAQNIQGLLGEPLGRSNLYQFDTNNRGGTLLQHSAPVMYSALFLVDNSANLLSSLDYARREYTRFKNKFLEAVINRVDISTENIPQIFDSIIYNLNKDKNPKDFAFFNSNMIAYGLSGDEARFTVFNPANKVFDLKSIELTNFTAHLVYLNNLLLIKDLDYTWNGTNVTLSNNITISIDDQIVIKVYREFTNSYIPETPTKLGLYPKFLPSKFIDNTLGDSGVNVIQGHDGSITVAFNDYRDDLLLELEKRIYNNLSVNYDPTRFDLTEITPGRYRRTDYTPEEFNRVINSEFLKWAGFNHLEYATNSDYMPNNGFTFNYNRCQNELGRNVPGHWRGIYKFYYDTDRPHTHPWEILGHTIKPTWWDTYYSWTEPTKRSALIIAITEGYTQNPALPGSPLSSPLHSRSGFSSMIPVDPSGNLVAPINLMIRANDSSTFGRNFTLGDHGPAETAWRRSSEYPFALQRAMALLKPARYFGLNIDITRYNKKYIGDNIQFALTKNSKRPNPRDIVLNGEEINGQIQISASYINWIIGYLISEGIEPITYLRNRLDKLTVNLTHKLGGFSDKKYLNVFAEQFAPDSKAQSIVVPNENYEVYLNKSVPVERAVYSAVIIEKTNNGYSVTGYDKRYPYFTIIPSEPAGSSYTIEILTKRAVVFTEFRSEKIVIPYGYEFTDDQQIVDFLVSYQRFLIAQGFLFNNYDPILEVPKDWVLSAKEFLTWSMQGWKSGNILVLSPIIDKIELASNEGFVDEITNQLYQSRVLGANFNAIKKTDLMLLRDDNITTIKTVSGQTIALVDVNIIEFEHILIFDNITVFNDMIYNPVNGNRQFRMKLNGSKTNQWTGSLVPPGFVYTTPESKEWVDNKLYNKGDIVSYKNKLYTASQRIDPSEIFNFNYWKELDSVIESGITPNFSNIVDRLKDIYNVDNLPLDEEFVKFSGSLIGYRSRPYLTDLGLNEVSQIKFYQGFIKEKGTYSAIDKLARGDFDNINNDIEIYEDWGARIGVFGGIDLNPEISLSISESLPNRNPLVLEFLEYGSQPANTDINPIYPNQLVMRPYDYVNKLFLNRNESSLSRDSRQGSSEDQENKLRLTKIELFGDGIMCGQQPTDLTAYSITAVQNLAYDVEVYGQSSYTIRTLNQLNQMIFEPETINGKLIFDIGSLTDIEDLEYEIAESTGQENQLSVSTLVNTPIQTLIPGQPFSITVFSVLPAEQLTIEIEAPNTLDALQQNPTVTELVSKVTAVINNKGKAGIQFSVTGIETTEKLYYSIEEYNEDDDQVLVSTYSEYGLACFPMPGSGINNINRNINRVSSPPDILLYESLENYAATSVLTRSVGASMSEDLLNGDGANDEWPDQIEADLVLINHGYNDARNDVPIETYKNNLREIRNRLPRSKTILWVLPTRPNMDLKNENALPDPRVDWNRDNRLDLYINAMREVAIANGDYIADTTKIPNWNQYFLIDPVYPTQEGYRALIDYAIAPAVKKVLKDKIKSTEKSYENDVKSAGYVIAEEVDELVFDIANWTVTADDLVKYTNGYKIWFAKDFNEDWQVYRLYKNDVAIVGATANLENKFNLIFEKDHSYSIGDLIIVRNFNVLIDGLYTILGADSRTITVQGTEQITNLLQQYDLESIADNFDFQKLRFENIEQRNALMPKHGWLSTDFIYVDDNGLGRWEVFKGKLDSYSNIEIFGADVIYSGKYDITATDCGAVEVERVTILNTVGIADQLHFNISSIEDAEDLYYTVEEVTDEDVEITTQIEKLFYLYLDRAPDKGTYDYYVDLVQRGKASLTDIEQAIKTTPEAIFLSARTRDFGNVSTVVETTELISTPIYKFETIRKERNLVDIDSVNNAYVYSNKEKRILARLDLFDPAKGRLLGTAQQDLDYTLSVDPAVYNKSSDVSQSIGFSETYFWGPEYVGHYWWNIDNCRYTFYEHSTVDKRGQNWGKLFPGSTIEIYEWIESDVIPSVHVTLGRDGTPLYPNDVGYSEKVVVDPSSLTFSSRYYFWVKNRSAKSNKAKVHSVTALSDVIENPISQNIPFMAAVKDNAVALFNVGQFLNGTDTMLYLSSKRQLTDNIVHSDFALIQEGNIESPLPEYLVEKLIDSLSGIDQFNNMIPDMTLPFPRRYGIENFPRQSAIIDQYKAKENIVKYVNSVLIRYPLTRLVNNGQGNLWAQQPVNTSWYDEEVGIFSDLEDPVPRNNLRILVRSDARNNFYWTIYQVVRIKTNQLTYRFEYTDFAKDYPLIRATVSGIDPVTGDKTYDYYGYTLIRRQGFKTTNYWNYTNWYANGFTKDTVPNYVVGTNRDIYKLNIQENDIVRVLNVSTEFGTLVDYDIDFDQYTNAELYKYTSSEGQMLGTLVGINGGTIQLSPDLYKKWGFDSERFDTFGFDFDVNKEFRYILKGLQNEIFVNELEIEWNRTLYYLIDLILAEQKYIDWFFKSSFISINHNVNGLKQIPGYVKDRQQSFAEFINEVKPYRTKIREYKLTYNDIDVNRLTVTDFDLPAIWDSRVEQFRSPNNEYSHDGNLLARSQYQDWVQNHKYHIGNIDIVSGGYNYSGIFSGVTAPPSIVITRNDSNIGANASALAQVTAISPFSVTGISIRDIGGNYTATPSLHIINNGADQFTDYRINKYVVVSQGLSDTVAGTTGNVAWGLYSVDSLGNQKVLYNTTGRSYTLHRIRRSDGRVVLSKGYDVYGTAGQDNELADDLNRTTSDYIVVVHTFDEPKTNRTSTNLLQAMYRCGASGEVYASIDFKFRSAYILVGIPGSGQGNGIENYSGFGDNSTNAYCRLEFNLYQSQLIPVEAYPRIYSIGSNVSFPINPTINSLYQFKNKAWFYNGNSWIIVKKPVSSLPQDQVRKSIVLTPRLENTLTRKIKLTIKFDRIRFTSNVTTWVPTINHREGSVVSYYNAETQKLHAYKFINDVPVGSTNDKFPFSDVVEITDHSEFDNANDRIRAFYQSSPYNENIPNNLSRLVSGLAALPSVTSEDTDPDTILIADTFGSNAGISAGNIRVTGGTFVSDVLIRSPEELVPGRVFESLTVEIREASTIDGFRFFIDISGNVSGTSYTTASTTTLAQPIYLATGNITVVDGTKLSAPAPVVVGGVTVDVIPGVILVNGERIAYYSKAGNILTQIRRGYKGTSTPETHLAGSKVEDVSSARTSSTYMTDYTRPVPPAPIGFWSITPRVTTVVGRNPYIFDWTAPSTAPGNVTVSWYAVDPGTVNLFANTGITTSGNLGYIYNLPITATSGNIRINTQQIFGYPQEFQVILTEGVITANVLARSLTANIIANTTVSTIPAVQSFTAGYYYEGINADRFAGLWSIPKTHTMDNITGLGSVNVHGPTPGFYELNLNNLPVHNEKQFSMIMHFVDSLDGETSRITLGNVLYAEFTKVYNVAELNYSVNLFASNVFTIADYSYAPWGNNSTKNGFVRFETSWIASNSSSFSANIYLGHNQPQSDEAIYFSHVSLKLRGGNVAITPTLPMPTINFVVSNITSITGYTLVSNTYTSSNTITIPTGVTMVQITGRGQGGTAANLSWENSWVTGDPEFGPTFATVSPTSIHSIPSTIIENQAQSQYNSLPTTRVTQGANVQFTNRSYIGGRLTQTTYAARVRLKPGVEKLKSGTGWGSSYITPPNEYRTYSVLSTLYEEYRGGSSGDPAAFGTITLPGGKNGTVAPLTVTTVPVLPGLTYPITVPTGGIVNVQYLQPNVITIIDPNPLRARVFATPGSYSWTAPAGITRIHVLCVGGGGGGSYAGYGDAGGGGGGTGFINFYTVTPGSTYTVVVGAGGTSNGNQIGGNGGDSYFVSNITVAGFGGRGGGQPFSSTGGAFIGTGGGRGGRGGITGSGGGAGGGGAGGYSGSGGNGGNYQEDGTSGSGGGGGGGAGQDTLNGFGGGAGGGISFYGEGTSGAGGETGTLISRHGVSGSGATTSLNTYAGGASGSNFGGGGGSGSSSSIVGAQFGGRGGGGLVVIYYGTAVADFTSSLPSTNMNIIYLDS